MSTATLDGCTAARAATCSFIGDLAEQVPLGRVGLRERAGKPVAGANVDLGEVRRPVLLAGEPQPGHEAAVAQEGAPIARRRGPERSLGEEHFHQVEARDHPARGDRLDVKAREPGCAVEADEARLAAHLAGGWKRREQPQRHDAVRVGDAVGGDLRAPVAETVVGDAVGQRVEERLVEQAARRAASRGVEERRRRRRERAARERSNWNDGPVKEGRRTR